MSAVATKCKPVLDQEARQALSSLQSIIVSSVAQIFRARGYFSPPANEEVFDSRIFNSELLVYTFKKDAVAKNEEVKELVNLLEDVMDAVQKKYLHQLILSFYEKSPNEPLENYSFFFGYEKEDLELSVGFSQGEDGRQGKVSSKQLLLSSTTSVFKTLQKVLDKAGRVRSLPSGIHWTYTLKYYPHTPRDYHIPNDGFYRLKEGIPDSFLQLGYEQRSEVLNASHTQMAIKIKTQYDVEDGNGTMITGDLDYSLPDRMSSQ